MNDVKHFGEHVFIDGYEGLLELLDSKDGVGEYITVMAQKLDMRMLSDVLVYYAKGNQ